MSSGRSKPLPLHMLVTSAGRRCELIDCFRADARDLGIELRVSAADLNPRMSPACHHADSSFPVGRCTDPAYPQQVLDLCRANEITLIVPTIDTELQVFADHAPNFAESGVRVVVSSPDSVRACRDKAETSRVLAAAGVTVPRTVLLSEFTSETFPAGAPLILKPIGGSSSVGIARFTSGEQVPKQTDPEKWIVQEYIDGPEFTVNAFVSPSGELITAIPHLRQEVRAGEVSKGTTQTIPELGEMAQRIVSALPGLRGPFCFQAKLHANGRYYIFEINARFGGGFPLAHHAGGKFSRWLLEEHCQRPSTMTERWSPGVTFLRYDQAIFIQS